MASSLYLTLSENELQEILSKSLQAQALGSRLLSGGLFNTTYLVDTREYGKVVLRAGPVNRHLLMPFEHHLMEAEEEVYALLAEHGVPASEILAVDTSRAIVDRDFMIVRYIAASPMSELSLGIQDRARISRQIGEAAAKMHAITCGRFGRIVDVKNGGGFARWSEALLHELYEWERVGTGAFLFTEREHEEIRSLFERSAPYLDEIRLPHLVHADLWTGNILVRTDTKEPEFAAIIDADRALWGDTDFEFSSIQWTYSEEAFWQGYGRPLSQSRESCIRRRLYTLLNRLWNAYVFRAEYNQPKECEAEREDAVRQMAELEKLLKKD